MKRSKKTAAAKLQFTGLPRLRPHAIVSDAAIEDSKRDERIRRAAERAMEWVDQLGCEYSETLTRQHWTAAARTAYESAIRALKAILREVGE